MIPIGSKVRHKKTGAEGVVIDAYTRDRNYGKDTKSYVRVRVAPWIQREWNVENVEIKRNPLTIKPE